MLRRLAMTLVVAALGVACSPISAQREISDAQGALKAAEQADAPRLAVYEYTAATEYLHKAREEINYSDYDAARSYAAHARELAQEARARAERERTARLPAPPPDSDAPVTRTGAASTPSSAEADDNPQDADDPIKKRSSGKRP